MQPTPQQRTEDVISAQRRRILADHANGRISQADADRNLTALRRADDLNGGPMYDQEAESRDELVRRAADDRLNQLGGSTSTKAELDALRTTAEDIALHGFEEPFETMDELARYAAELTNAAMRSDPSADVVIALASNVLSLDGCTDGPALVAYRLPAACEFGCGSLADSREAERGHCESVQWWQCSTCEEHNSAELVTVAAVHGDETQGWFAPSPEGVAAAVRLGMAAADAQRRALASAEAWAWTQLAAEESGRIAAADPSLGGSEILERWVHDTLDGLTEIDADSRLSVRLETGGWGTGPDSLEGLRPWEAFAVWCPGTQEVLMCHSGPDPSGDPAQVETVVCLDHNAIEHTAAVITVASAAAETLRAQVRPAWPVLGPGSVLNMRKGPYMVRARFVEANARHIDEPLMPLEGASTGIVRGGGWAAEEPASRSLSL